MKEILLETVEKSKAGWKRDIQAKLQKEYPELFRELVFLEEQINAKMIEGAREDEIKLLIDKWSELIDKIKREVDD